MQLKTLAFFAALSVFPAVADNVVHPGTPVLDRPTLTALGVQLPITGDDNLNASVTARYRKSGTTLWLQALPLFRVHPENTVLYTLVPQFAGSIFNLRPATSYDIELHVTDPDGPVDQTFLLTAVTRPVPADPPAPRIVNVNSVAALGSALGSAQPGDIIQLADNIYNVNSLNIFANGTAQNPIVLRGTTEAGTILDGGNCLPCNILQVYGGFIHIERMTLQSAERAIRFYNPTEGNVVRRVHVKDTVMGIHGNDNQKDYYIADNILEGRLTWPNNYGADNAAHANDDGIVVHGFGHVVCHNQISGYADALQVNQNGSRALDFYGNEILWTYDNGIELDSSEGNTRAFRNRFTNGWDILSVQPVLGGPAYMFRNVVVNSVDEQMKFHAIGTNPPQEPNGVISYNNTFVSPNSDINLCTPNSSHHFWIENNLFIGPAALPGRAVKWCGPVDDGHFDYDGYWPDGSFSFNLPVPGGYAYFNWPDFGSMQAGGMETHGTLLSGLIFANGLIGPQTYTILMPPQDVTLASGSSAIDRGTTLPNINDGYTGGAPDLGALEVGCPIPIYGPRPAGVDETNEPIGCESSGVPSVSVSIAPASASLGVNQSRTFIATVTGASDNSVTWTASPSNVGKISNGTYTAPATISTQQTVTITATSVADNTKSATAAVTLVPPVTYTISGQVTRGGSALNGVTVSLSGSQSGSATTSGSGSYSFTGLTPAGNYTVTASLSGYSFNPPSQSLNNLSANQTANFIATATTANSNLALGKAATQSSTLSGYGPMTVAASVVDGNTDGNFYNGSVSHTNADVNAWWQVDLGSLATVSSIVIWNRTDCCGDRLSDYWVFVSNTAFGPTDTPATLQARAGTWSSHQTTFPNPSTTIGVNAPGRYVRVQLSGTDYLHLAEVQVLGSTSSAATYGVSGQITLSGVAQNGVTVTLSGSQAGSTTTNSSGAYGFTGLASGGNYTVTPSLSGYSFAPISQTLNNLSANQSVNFTATATPAISNLAVGKPATQSTTMGGYGAMTGASSAADGNTDGKFYDGSVSHTNAEANAWWQVDLGSSASVSSIVIWNRTDCCGDRLSDYWVFVSNTPFGPADTPATLQGRAGTWSSHQTIFPNPSTTIAANTSGRYVRVQLSGSNYLHLAEVQVFGSTSATPSYGISGQVTLSGAGQSGVTVSLSGSQGGSIATNSSGSYSFTGLPAGGSYTVTPSLSGYSFSPPSQTFNNLSAAQTVNFTATATSTTSNLALGKSATQSSTGVYGPPAAASNAVDGNTEGNFYNGSVTHTKPDANAWWQVDLGNSATVSSIVIWNRTDCCSDRLSDYWVFVSNTPFGATDTPATLQGRAGTWSSHQTMFPNPSSTIAVNAAGRYVRVQLSGTNYLHLAEVQVFGQ